MEKIKIRRYKDGDETEICKIIQKDVLAENIKDYTPKAIERLIKTHNEELISRRAKAFHTYVFLINEKIIGVGMIGPYWNSLTESSFFTIFINPEYKGKGLGRKIIETLESDEYYKRATRVEIPASITAMEFYKHFGYGFKKFGNIVDNEGIYRMEKYPKLSNDNTDSSQYNMRSYIDNEYHNYKEFVYQTWKEAYQKYIEEYFGPWNEEEQRKAFLTHLINNRKNFWIIQLNGKDIGFYSGKLLENGNYEIQNICIVPAYQGKKIGTQVLNDIIELHKNQDIYVQYFKQIPISDMYKRLGFISNGETEFYYQMKKNKEDEKI